MPRHMSKYVVAVCPERSVNDPLRRQLSATRRASWSNEVGTTVILARRGDRVAGPVWLLSSSLVSGVNGVRPEELESPTF